MKILKLFLFLVWYFSYTSCQGQNNTNLFLEITSEDFKSYLSLYNIINLPLNSDSIINLKKKSLKDEEYEIFIKKYLCERNDCFASNAKYWGCGLVNHNIGNFVLTLSRFENELSYSFYKLNTYDYSGKRIDELVFYEGTELYNTLPNEIETIQKRGEITQNLEVFVQEFKTYTAFKDTNGIYNFFGVFQKINYTLNSDGYFIVSFKSEPEKRRYDINHQAPEGQFPSFLPVD